METIEERLERIERLTLLSAKTALNMDDMAASAPMPHLSSLHTRKPQSSYGLRKKWE